jgi:catechol 2,3-dioxygenase-like lactoylglutathione lyase family enzyme
MATGIDHVVIAVRDLDQAASDFTAAGFTVTPGGEHVNGITHNALIAFQDGSYFEVIAWKSPDESQDTEWWRRLNLGEGFVDYALRTTDLHVEVARLRADGLDAPDPTPGGRLRPDGQRVEWETLRLDPATHPSLPFWCHSTNDRSLRVPSGAQAVHANGATGIEAITIGVSDLAQAVADYEIVAGISGAIESRPADGTTDQSFQIGPVMVTLTQASDPASDLGRAIAARGDVPIAIHLNGQSKGPLDTRLTHGAAITLVPLASEHLSGHPQV